MSALRSPSEPALRSLEANRVRARVVIQAQAAHDAQEVNVGPAPHGASRLHKLREGGGYRVKFPASTGVLEAVVVNVGGGVAGGDVVSFTIEVRDHARLVVSSQAAEKVYRSAGGDAGIETSIAIGSRGALSLAPQETILFDGARLARRLDVVMARDASAFLFDMTVFGRVAAGETIARGMFRDRWRILRGDVLVHADDVAIGPQMCAALDRLAGGCEARAVLSGAIVSPEAENLVEPVRECLASFPVLSGASAWDGKLVVRAASRDPAALRGAYAQLAAKFGGVSVSRYW